MNVHDTRNTSARDIARRLEPYLAGLNRPAGEAEGLPGWLYTSPDVFEAERRAIFAPGWIGIGYASEVANPGDAISADYAGWRFLVIRGDDRKVRVFHNMCRHRGLPIVEGFRSSRPTVSCPWHMWTYDLEGRLIATPNLGGTGVNECPGFNKGELGLIEVRSAIWMGVVFVNVDGKAPALEQHLAPTTERLKDFDLSLVTESSETLETRFEGNWKLGIEGGVEDYHIPWVHKQLGPSGDFRGEWAGDSWVGVTCRRDMAAARARYVDPAAAAAGGTLPLFPHLPETGMAEASIILSMLPANLIAAVTDHVVVSLFIPEAPNRTRVRRRFFFLGEAATSSAHAVARKRVRDAWDIVTEQDGPIIARMQQLAGVRDEIGFRPRFSPYWEPAVHHFQKVVASRLAGAALG